MISIEVIGDKEVVANLGKITEAVKKSITAAVFSVTLALAAKVKTDKLSGGVLNVRTGRLRRSITSRVREEADGIVGTVGTNVEYAPIHEFGFSGQVAIAAHLRMMKQAWGRPVKSPREIMVSAHSRNVNLPERSFLRSALREMAPDIQQKIAKAVDDGLKGAR